MSPNPAEQQKSSVQSYYDQHGWRKLKDGAYHDTSSYTDTREVARRYYEQTIARTRKYLPARGAMVLEAGCGAIPATAYYALDAYFNTCICTDFSRTALDEARKDLGARACYVQADLTQLPFRDGVFDASFCAHVIYHIPPGQQPAAFQELFRTLRAGGASVVIYTWSGSVGDTLARWLNPRVLGPKIPGLRWVWRRYFKKRYAPAPVSAHSPEDTLYFAPQSRAWIRREVLGVLPARMYCWQSVGLPFFQAFIPATSIGSAVLNIIQWFEGRLPALMGWLGNYPLIVIRKAP